MSSNVLLKKGFFSMSKRVLLLCVRYNSADWARMVLTGCESTVRKKGLVTRDSEGNVLIRSFRGINLIIFRF